MDFDKPKVYGDTSITDGLVQFAYCILCMDFVPGPEHPPLTPQPITPHPVYVMTLGTSRPPYLIFVTGATGGARVNFFWVGGQS